MASVYSEEREEKDGGPGAVCAALTHLGEGGTAVGGTRDPLPRREAGLRCHRLAQHGHRETDLQP